MKRFGIVVGVYGAAAPFMLAILKPSLFGGWFPQWSRFICHVLSKIMSVVPFPVAEIAEYAAIIAVPAYWILSFKRRRGIRRAFKVTLVWAAAFAAAAVWFWQLNYFCPSPSSRMGFEPSPVLKEELIRVAEFYRDGVNLAYVVTEQDFDGLAAGVVNGFNKLSEEYSFIMPNPAKPKRLVFGIVQSYLGISGIFMPLTAESCVVGDTPPPELPATMAHELAHRQGAAAEDEANFIGILACLASDDPRVRYSGFFDAFLHLYNAVYRQDSQAGLKLLEGLDERVIDDLVDLSKHYEKYQGPVSEAGEAINDAYLKTMQQKEGVKSYGMVVDLLIAYNKVKHG